MKKILRYFLRGVLFTVPLFITIYILYKIIISIGSFISDLGISIHPAIDPFIGFLSVIALIILIGIVGSNVIFERFFKWMEEMIGRAPLVKIIYSSIKDLLSAFVGQKKRFNQPVLVTLGHNPTIEKLGFITKTDLLEFGINEEKVAVYLPHSYNFSGNLIIISKQFVKPIPVNASDAMKFIVSAGITNVDKVSSIN